MTPATRRKFLALGLGGLAATAVAACGGATAGGAETKTLRYQGWSGQVTLPELAQDLGFLGDVTLEWVGNTTSGPQDIQSAATGQIDFGGAFNGAVVKLAAAGAPIKSVISYYGADAATFNGFYVLGDSPIRTARDLIGRKVGMNTLGAHSEAMLNIYLQRNGLGPAEIAQVEPLALPPVNTEQSLRQRQIDVAVLGGILRDKAVAAGGVRQLFSDFDLLGAFNAGTYVMTKSFLGANPGTARTFVTGVAKAIEWSKTTPVADVVNRMTAIVAKRNRNESPDALRYWKSYGVAATGGAIGEKDLSIWLDWLRSRGELKQQDLRIPDIYTNEFNDLAGK